jgi:chorismate--pyruvate lyase
LSFHFSQQDPHWQAVNYRHHQLPKHVQHWLLDQGSLTQKLIDQSDGKLKVEVLHQGIQRARLSEYRALGLNPGSWALIREVILYGNETPWVYARTVIPLSTLKGPLRRLYYLGNRPLGGELFADPTMRRRGLEVAAVKPAFLPKRAQHLKPQWGRRSIFWLRNKPLLVGEIFLTDLLE